LLSAASFRMQAQVMGSAELALWARTKALAA